MEVMRQLKCRECKRWIDAPPRATEGIIVPYHDRWPMLKMVCVGSKQEAVEERGCP